MEELVLSAIQTTGTNALRYDFSASDGLEKYFSDVPFVIEYPVDISSVPEAVLAIPFICNVLPIIWLTDSRLVVEEMDRAFYDCLPNVKKGYEGMFPESRFAGEICPKRLVDCDHENNGCGAFFSGGLDATQTLVSHIQERPHLISIWGSDIQWDNPEGWKVVHDGICETAQRFSLPDAVIRSSFRQFDREDVLHSEFAAQLKDGWWHGVKHGLALLGHAAPYAYVQGLGTMYIGSSHCPLDGVVRCASNPAIDNHVRYGSCRVVHDGFEFSRQDKVHNVVEFVNQTGNSITLHACWQSQSGKNCCHCEKCYRTMAAILAEGADPAEYGFDEAEKNLPNMQNYIVEGKALNKNLAISGWMHIHNRVRQNKKALRSRKEWKYIKWIEKADFTQHEKLKMPLNNRIRGSLAKIKLYQTMSRMKRKLLKR